jgi:hypothetical protein
MLGQCTLGVISKYTPEGERVLVFGKKGFTVKKLSWVRTGFRK